MGQSNRIDLYSPWSPTECAARIAATLDNPWPTLILPAVIESQPVAGKVSASQLKLSRRINYRNSFQPCLMATFRPLAAGTAISGRVGLDPFVWLFLAFFVYMGTSILGMFIFPSFGNLLPAVVIAAGFAWYRFGPALASRETLFFREFLAHTLDARSTPDVARND